MKEKNLFQEERLRIIYETVQQKNKVLVNDLAEEFSISKTTARNDLMELESRGLITRTHGGAILRNSDSELQKEIVRDNVPVTERISDRLDEKKAIGKLAATLINDGDTLMIDGGTTTSVFVDYLKDKKDLTIITNSYTLVPPLAKLENCVIYLAGGLVYDKHSVVVGDFSNDFIAQFKPNKLVLGIDGVTANRGLSIADSQVPSVASIKRKMMESCDEVILICDYTKFGKECLMTVAPVNKVDFIVTNPAVDRNEMQDIQALGPKILLTDS